MKTAERKYSDLESNLEERFSGNLYAKEKNLQSFNIFKTIEDESRNIDLGLFKIPSEQRNEEQVRSLAKLIDFNIFNDKIVSNKNLKEINIQIIINCLLRNMKVLSLKEKDTLFRIGNTDDLLFLILKGKTAAFYPKEESYYTAQKDYFQQIDDLYNNRDYVLLKYTLAKNQGKDCISSISDLVAYKLLIVKKLLKNIIKNEKIIFKFIIEKLNTEFDEVKDSVRNLLQIHYSIIKENENYKKKQEKNKHNDSKVEHDEQAKPKIDQFATFEKQTKLNEAYEFMISNLNKILKRKNNNSERSQGIGSFNLSDLYFPEKSRFYEKFLQIDLFKNTKKFFYFIIVNLIYYLYYCKIKEYEKSQSLEALYEYYEAKLFNDYYDNPDISFENLKFEQSKEKDEKNENLNRLKFTNSNKRFFEQMQNFSLSKEVAFYSIYEYEKGEQLSEGTFFGELGIETEIKKRKATVMCEGNCYVGFIDKHLYFNQLLEEKNKMQEIECSFLNKLIFFSEIKSSGFKKNYFPKCKLVERSRDDHIINQGKSTNDIFILRQGSLEVSINCTLTELMEYIDKMINLAFQHNLISEKERDTLQSELNPPLNFKNISPEVKNRMNIKKEFKIFTLNDHQIFAIEFCILEIEAIYSVKVTSDLVKVYSINNELFKAKIFLGYPQAKKNYEDFAVNKIKSLVRRLRDLKNHFFNVNGLNPFLHKNSHESTSKAEIHDIIHKFRESSEININNGHGLKKARKLDNGNENEDVNNNGKGKSTTALLNPLKFRNSVSLKSIPDILLHDEHQSRTKENHTEENNNKKCSEPKGENIDKHFINHKKILNEIQTKKRNSVFQITPQSFKGFSIKEKTEESFPQINEKYKHFISPTKSRKKHIIENYEIDNSLCENSQEDADYQSDESEFNTNENALPILSPKNNRDNKNLIEDEYAPKNEPPINSKPLNIDSPPETKYNSNETSDKDRLDNNNIHSRADQAYYLNKFEENFNPYDELFIKKDSSKNETLHSLIPDKSTFFNQNDRNIIINMNNKTINNNFYIDRENPIIKDIVKSPSNLSEKFMDKIFINKTKYKLKIPDNVNLDELKKAKLIPSNVYKTEENNHPHSSNFENLNFGTKNSSKNYSSFHSPLVSNNINHSLNKTGSTKGDKQNIPNSLSITRNSDKSKNIESKLDNVNSSDHFKQTKFNPKYFKTEEITINSNKISENSVMKNFLSEANFKGDYEQSINAQEKILLKEYTQPKTGVEASKNDNMTKDSFNVYFNDNSSKDLMNMDSVSRASSFDFQKPKISNNKSSLNEKEKIQIKDSLDKLIANNIKHDLNYKEAFGHTNNLDLMNKNIGQVHIKAEDFNSNTKPNHDHHLKNSKFFPHVTSNLFKDQLKNSIFKKSPNRIDNKNKLEEYKTTKSMIYVNPLKDNISTQNNYYINSERRDKDYIVIKHLNKVGIDVFNKDFFNATVKNNQRENIEQNPNSHKYDRIISNSLNKRINPSRIANMLLEDDNKNNYVMNFQKIETPYEMIRDNSVHQNIRSLKLRVQNSHVKKIFNCKK